MRLLVALIQPDWCRSTGHTKRAQAHSACTEEKSPEHTGRRRQPARQAERPPKEPALPTPWCQLPASRTGTEETSAVSAAQSVVLCYSRPRNEHRRTQQSSYGFLAKKRTNLKLIMKKPTENSNLGTLQNNLKMLFESDMVMTGRTEDCHR